MRQFIAGENGLSQGENAWRKRPVAGQKNGESPGKAAHLGPALHLEG
jgi:hypothetical protein